MKQRSLLANGTIQSLLWLCLLLLPTSTWLLEGDASVQYTTIAIYAVLVIVWGASVVARGRSIRIPRYLIPLLALFALMSVRNVSSPLPTHGWEILVEFGILLAFLVILGAEIGRAFRPESGLNALILFGFAISMGNTFLIINWLVSWMSLRAGSGLQVPFGFRLPGAFLGHPNIEAGFLALLIPLAFLRLRRAASRWSQVKWLLILGLFLLVLFFSSSRAGWISTFVGVLTMYSFLLVPRIKGLDLDAFLQQARIFVRRNSIFFLLGIPLAALAMALLLTQVANTPHAPMASARFPVWSTGLEILLQSPWVGHGPGSVHVLVLAVDRLISEPYFIHPHNLTLVVLDETGVLGLGLVALAVYLFARDAIDKWSDSSPEQKIRLAATFGALATVVVHNQADVLFEAPVYSVAVLMLALPVASYANRGRSLVARPVLAIPTVLVVLLLLAANLQLFRGVGDMETGVQEWTSGDQAQGLRALCLGADSFPSYGLAQIECGLALARLAAEQPDPSLLVQARDRLQSGLTVDPYWPTHWANLGALRWQLGNKLEAVDDLQQARLRAPYDARILATYGRMAESSGNFALARDLYRELLEHNPTLSESVFFTTGGVRQEVLASQLDYSYTNPSEGLLIAGWRHLGAGDPEAALGYFIEALAISPTHRLARTGKAVSLQAMGRKDQAWYEAQIALLGGTSDPRLLLNIGRLMYQQGREQIAQGLLEYGWKETLDRSDSDRYYGIVYRRAFLPFDTVPQVIDPRLTVDMAEALKTLATQWEEEGRGDEAALILKFIRDAEGRIE